MATRKCCKYIPDDRRFVDMFPHTGDIHTAVSGQSEAIGWMKCKNSILISECSRTLIYH